MWLGKATYDSGKAMDLKQVLTFSRVSKQADPRNKVYGVLGLVDERLSNLISPNYALSTLEVVKNFAQAVSRPSGSLGIINCQGTASLNQLCHHRC